MTASAPDQGQVTRYLQEWKKGDQSARDSLVALVYQEMRRLAAGYLRGERSAVTLQPTVLVHETYLRLATQKLPDWKGRSHFFGVAAHLMRQILVDHARRHKSEKRGNGEPKAPFDEALRLIQEPSSQVLALDDALTALAELDPRKCRIIELRFFAGLSLEETARALGLSVATVGREQRVAEAWLRREISRENGR